MLTIINVLQHDKSFIVVHKTPHECFVKRFPMFELFILGPITTKIHHLPIDIRNQKSEIRNHQNVAYFLS